MWEKKKKNETHEEFMEKNFVKCPHCGYNNKIELFAKYGTCLKCLKILDDKVYFRTKLGIIRRIKRYEEVR